MGGGITYPSLLGQTLSLIKILKPGFLTIFGEKEGEGERGEREREREIETERKERVLRQIGVTLSPPLIIAHSLPSL